jgi:hypothetical protein
MVKTLAWVFGVVFLVVGLLGLFQNPILGIFATDGLHNTVHLLTGVVGVIAALSGEKGSKLYLQVFGVVYALVAVLGFFGGTSILGLITTNVADNILHAVVAAVLLWGGFGKMRQGAMMPASS